MDIHPPSSADLSIRHSGPRAGACRPSAVHKPKACSKAAIDTVTVRSPESGMVISRKTAYAYISCCYYCFNLVFRLPRMTRWQPARERPERDLHFCANPQSSCFELGRTLG